MDPHSKTIDLHEVTKFSDQSAHWWDETGPFKPLHQLNPLRIRYIRDTLSRHTGQNTLEGLDILDVGCGGGLLCEPLARLGATVTGIDAADKAIQVAQAHAQAQHLDIQYIHGTPETLDPKKTFEGVCALEIVEHVADLPQFIESAIALIKPGGLFFFSTLNRTFKSMMLGKIAAEYILRLVPPGTHDWRKFVKPSELDRLLRANHVEIQSLRGITFNPLKNQFHLTSDLGVNYIGYGVYAPPS